MYFQVGALSLTVVHGSRAGRPSDGEFYLYFESALASSDIATESKCAAI